MTRLEYRNPNLVSALNALEDRLMSALPPQLVNTAAALIQSFTYAIDGLIQGRVKIQPHLDPEDEDA